jgi:ATP-dependent Clp protease ATP-binding subunit ClpA
VIQNEIEDRLSEALLEGRFGPGDTVIIDVSEAGEVVLTKEEAPALASST